MEKNNNKVTTKQKVYEAVCRYIREHGYAPTVREIAELTGLKSISSVHCYLTRLYIDGLLETDHPESPRAIRVPELFAEQNKGNPCVSIN